jgi:glycosyltransferase involved in cell wall biosynthesis
VKVSLVVSDLSGAGAIRAFLLAQALIELNCEVEVVGFQFGKELYTIPPKGIPVCAIPGNNYPGFLMSAQQLLKKIDGDIIYAVKPKPTSFGLSLLKQLGIRRRVILDIDDWELSWFGGDEWKYHPSFKQLYRDILKKNGQLRQPDHPLYVKWMESLLFRADAVTVHTEFLKQRFGGIYLPNGKDTKMFDPAKYNPELSRQRYDLFEYRILMFPGAPRPHKGVEDVLIALEQLNEPDLRLAIVGGSPYDDYDDRLMQQWGHWIIKLPRFPIEMMPEVVAAAHVVVVPQRDTLTSVAQFPLKLTDGMAMAKPVLSTRVGDIPTILGGTGYLVDPNSPAQIAQKIQWIFQNLTVANCQGIKARERCLKKYSIQSMASILSDILTEILR